MCATMQSSKGHEDTTHIYERITPMTTTNDTRKVTKLGEVHPDMERYLLHDCYCPNEIYDITGFSYRLFPADTDCVVIEQSEDMTAVICAVRHAADGTPKWDDAQAIMFWHDNDDGDNPEHKIIDAQRVDATENNVGILRDIVRGVELDGRQLNEYVPGKMQRDMDRLMSLCGGVVIRD